MFFFYVHMFVFLRNLCIDGVFFCVRICCRHDIARNSIYYFDEYIFHYHCIRYSDFFVGCVYTYNFLRNLHSTLFVYDVHTVLNHHILRTGFSVYHEGTYFLLCIPHSDFVVYHEHKYLPRVILCNVV